MRTASTLAWLTSVLALACPAYAQSDPAKKLSPADFAYGIELTPAPEQPVQTLLVPLAVYRAAVRPDLGDVRVFNAADQLLPHALRKLAAPAPVEQPIAERERRVSVFPLLELPGTSTAVIEKLGVRIELGAGAIDIRGAAPTADAGAAEPRVIAHVLDAQAIDRSMMSLRIALTEPPEGPSYMASVAIDTSDDLSSWTPVVPDGVLARLAHEGRVVTRDRIELGGLRAKFLRVRSVGGDDVRSRVAEAWVEVAQTEAPAPALQNVRVSGRASTEPGVYDYDLGGAFPAEELRVHLPSAGTLIQAEVSVAAAKAETEQPSKTSAIRARTSKRIYDVVYDGPIYRLSAQGGRVLESPAVELDGRRIRYVSITVSESATLEAPPDLEVGYAPAQLLFVGREPAPFRLVYGSYAAAPSKMTADALLAPFGESRASLPESTVKLGAPSKLAGDAALTPPPPPPPIKTYVLWAVLIAGTLGITALAIRLLRKLD